MSYAFITMAANELVGEIHAKQRMPGILRPEDLDAWLFGGNDVAEECLRQLPSSELAAHEVSRRVNSPRNNDPTLLDPVGRGQS